MMDRCRGREASLLYVDIPPQVFAGPGRFDFSDERTLHSGTCLLAFTVTLGVAIEFCIGVHLLLARRSSKMNESQDLIFAWRC